MEIYDHKNKIELPFMYYTIYMINYERKYRQHSHWTADGTLP